MLQKKAKNSQNAGCVGRSAKMIFNKSSIELDDHDKALRFGIHYDMASDMKKTSNRSKSQQPTLEISMNHRHLLTLLENSTMKYLSPPYGMVSGLHTVLTSDWCVIIHLIIHLTNNHGSLQKV